MAEDDKIIRTPLDRRLLDEAFKRARLEADRRLAEHGPGIFASTHEVLGALVEEMRELEDAVRHDGFAAIMDELLDIAVAALSGFASVSQLNDNYLNPSTGVRNNVVDEHAIGANIYGCQPCPQCGLKFRYVHGKSGRIHCDDCGFKEDVAKENNG